mgnify:CR=1 FL=1
MDDNNSTLLDAIRITIGLEKIRKDIIINYVQKQTGCFVSNEDNIKMFTHENSNEEIISFCKRWRCFYCGL